MGLVIAALVLSTSAIVALKLAPRMSDGGVVYDARPDQPRPFGYRMCWLAIRTAETAAVVESLGLRAVHAANWDNGLGTIYSYDFAGDRIFVSPPVDGWTLVAGLALPQPMGPAFVDKTLPLLVALGRRFPEVQYFLSYPALDYFAWARLVDGNLRRAYAITDEGVVVSIGKPTREEKALGLRLYEVRGVKSRRGDAGGELVLYPTEAHVARLAGQWSLDPTRLGASVVPPAMGVLGTAPQAWRPQRLKRSA